MTKRDIIKLVFFIVICQLAGIIGSLATVPAVDTWYDTLTKPAFTPPDWIFGPVWVTLYLLMAVAAYLVSQSDASGKKRAFTVFFVQLVLNSLWSILFFGFKSPALAFVELLILWIIIVATTILFWLHSRWAGILFVPYLAWVSFAAFLNYAIMRLN